MAVNPFANAIAEAAQQTDMNEAQSGGDYTPPAAGLVRLRFVGYIELGKHDKEYQGTFSVNTTEDGSAYRLLLDSDPEELEKMNSFSLKVVHE